VLGCFDDMCPKRTCLPRHAAGTPPLPCLACREVLHLRVVHCRPIEDVPGGLVPVHRACGVFILDPQP
jgi:hypothetical protein